MRRVVGAIAVFVVFAVSYKGAQTTVRPSEVLFPSVSALTTAPPTTASVIRPPSTTVVLEPWISAPTTTTSTTTTTTPKRDIPLTSAEAPVLSELEALICAPQWEWNCGEAKRVAMCESSMRPGAVSPPNRNGTVDRGLFQVNTVWRESFGEALWSRILEPEVNVAMAHHIWVVGKRSWMYWTCQP